MLPTFGNASGLGFVMPKGPSTLASRFGLLLGGLLALFFATLLVVHRQDLRRAEEARVARQRAGERQLARWLDISSRPLQELLLDLAPWSETRNFLQSRDPLWARQHLESALADRQIEVVWLLRADGHVAYAGQRDPSVEPPALPSPADLADATRRASRLQFFAPGRDVLWQYQAAPVAPADGNLAGWLVAARRWDAAQLEQLAAVTECDVRLETTPRRADAGRPDQPTAWRRTLTDLNGHPVQDLVLTPRHDRREPDASTAQIILLFVVFAAALFTALGFAVKRWVLAPLGRLNTSLQQAAPEPIVALLERRDEFQPVAELVRQSFDHRAALERQIDERRQAEEALRVSEENLRHSVELRSRLARDLHDHVIQSIYAAGLGLEAVRAQMSVDPFGAEGRVRHCMDNLNETIRQVRSYINDLEPDATSDRQQFPAAVRALTGMMHQLWPVEFVLDLDEAAAARLTSIVEIHALQIVRELVSNAVRHGQASRVAITLAPNGAATELRVQDNGGGFDPVQRMGTGRGLVNLTSRAREMGATLRIESQPGAGTLVTVRFAAPAEEEP
ncbi:MAG: hypothetical protein C0518_12050 [Opitutus sp.]|nr:hypothetical protein [Opitutus sp.]